MKQRNLIKVSTILGMILLGSTLIVGADAFAKGGTAKPPNPKTAVAPVFVPTLSEPLLPGAAGAGGAPPGFVMLSAPPASINGFDVTGIITNATVGADGCSGSATMDNKLITVPCGLIVQMPANTLTWANYVNGGPATNLEMSAVGNNVNGTYIAALIFISQQSLHSGSGYITAINYGNGNITVDGVTTLQINDPFGRFGRVQSPDPRFSVDDQNPTIHAATGYPMCVPRTNPAVADDPLCPQKNRPLAAGGCRNFGASGNAPPVSGELTPPAVGQVYCSQYVMKALPGALVYPTNVAISPLFAMALPSDADPRKQAPFEVGDFITYAGTTMTGAGGTFISAHTIEANVGIYTTPGTLPAYVALGEFGIGTADLGVAPAAINGAAIETTNRLFLEAETSDFRTPVDIYLIDDTPFGPVRNRWVTPWEMTGECPPANGVAGLAGTPPVAANCGGVSGGITTATAGPQPNRARVRATKAPLGLLSQPSRTVRAMLRSLCLPVNPVNGVAPDGVNMAPVATAVDACINAAFTTAANPANAATTANGLAAGQYYAPVFEFIFPENVKPGDLTIPNDVWHLPFLRNGESGNPKLTPQPF